MVALIEKAREYELDAITHHAYWVQMGMMAAFQSMPQLMQLFVFTAYFSRRKYESVNRFCYDTVV